MTFPASTEMLQRNVLTVRQSYKDGFEQWYLLTTDVHWDNPHCNRDLYESHLKEAVRRGAGIIDNGDWFCAMQGRFDKRGSKGALREEHQVDNYWDALIETAAEWLKPYANNIIFLGTGNHETAVLKNMETNLTQRLATALNAGRKREDRTIYYGGYGNYVRFLFSNKMGTNRSSHVMKMFHGSGGASPVTKGVINASRRGLIFPDANIVFTGHTHEEWMFPITRERLNHNGVVCLDEQLHLQGATYKNDYADGFGGWAIEKGMPPQPIGAWWLRFYYKNRSICYEAMRAK